MITRRPTVDPRPISRSVFDVTYTKRRPRNLGLLRASCIAAVCAFVAVAVAYAR